MIKSIVAVAIVDSKHVGFDGISSFAAVVLDWNFTKYAIFLKLKNGSGLTLFFSLLEIIMKIDLVAIKLWNYVRGLLLVIR